MKLIVVILTACFMQVSATTLAQKLTYSKKGTTLAEIFAVIKNQTGYKVFYSDDKVNDKARIDVNFKDAAITDVLEKLVNSQNLEYNIDGKNISITAKESSLLDKLSTVISNIVRDLIVKGRVTDQDGKPLPNASIRVKGKSAVTNTNQNGEFEIKGVDEDAVLLVSYVGFKTLEISLKDAVMPLEIKLNVATGELEEVRVVYNTGYQIIDKTRVTGSFYQVDNETLNRRNSANIIDRIFDVVPGMVYNPSVGGGTQNEKIRGLLIRGVGTMSSSTIPLIVLDNFPYEGDLNSINPNDIENITVLKDAAAASIWGVRAGNGVIVLTSKSGKMNQKVTVQLSSSVTIGDKPDVKYVNTLSSKDEIEFEKNRFKSGYYNQFDDIYPANKDFPVLPQAAELLLAARNKNKGIPGYNALEDPAVLAQLDEMAKHDVRDDISKYLFQKSIDQQYAVNFSGGGNAFNYYGSVGDDRNGSNSIGNSRQRTTLRIDNTYRMLPNLELNAFISYTLSKTKSNAIDYTEFLPTGGKVTPYAMLADAEGKPLAIPKPIDGYRSAYVDTARYPLLLDWRYRPLDEQNNLNNSSRSNEIRVGSRLQYTVISGLVAALQYQYQKSTSNSENIQNENLYAVRNMINRFMDIDPVTRKVIYPIPLGGQAIFSSSIQASWNVRGSLNFNRNWGKHAVNSLAGIEFREITTSGSNQLFYGFNNDNYRFTVVDPLKLFNTRPNGIGIIGGPTLPSPTLARYGSYYANGSYVYDGKYILSGSGRIDQSNFFGVKANLRRVPLYSVGLGWNLSNETFFNVKEIDLIKVRASFGYNGNTNNSASSYLTMSYLNPSSFSIINAPLGQILNPPNPELRWEKIKVLNVGIDFGILRNRISGSIEYYQKTGLDLLDVITLDPTTGINTITGNKASIKGKGVDIQLNTKIFDGVFKWNTSFSLGYNLDKIFQLGRQVSTGAVAPGNLVIGRPRYSIESYRWAGLDPNSGTPRIYLADTVSSPNNYTKANLSDIRLHGSAIPKLSGNFRNSFSWKQLDVSFSLNYKFGHYFRRNSIQYSSLFNGWGGHSDYSLRWRKPGDELFTNVPLEPVQVNSVNDRVYQNSEILVENADHIRLQDIRIEYVFRHVTNRKIFKRASLFVYGNNLGIIWRANRYRIDPDVTRFGILPVPKSIAFGLNVGL